MMKLSCAPSSHFGCCPRLAWQSLASVTPLVSAYTCKKRTSLPQHGSVTLRYILKPSAIHDTNNNKCLHCPAHVLGVCGPSVIPPDRLVLSVPQVDVQHAKIRQNNVHIHNVVPLQHLDVWLLLLTCFTTAGISNSLDISSHMQQGYETQKRSHCIQSSAQPYLTQIAGFSCVVTWSCQKPGLAMLVKLLARKASSFRAKVRLGVWEVPIPGHRFWVPSQDGVSATCCHVSSDDFAHLSSTYFLVKARVWLRTSDVPIPGQI